LGEGHFATGMTWYSIETIICYTIFGDGTSQTIYVAENILWTWALKHANSGKLRKGWTWEERTKQATLPGRGMSPPHGHWGL